MKFTSGIIFACFILMVGAKNVRPRVLSYKLSPDTAYPFEAVVIIDEIYACTATLISNRQLITVAHCIAHELLTSERDARVKIRFGSVRRRHGSNYRVKRISHHLNFLEPYPNYYINDIAVIHTVNPVLLSNELRPIGLPAPDSDVSPKVLVLLSTFSGQPWNDRTVWPLLMRVITNSITATECQDLFKSYTLIKGQVCIEVNPEFRYGPVDVGAPMINFVESTILGIGSTGYASNESKEIPKIFTKISEYIPYILEEINYGTPNQSSINQSPAINYIWNF